MRFARLDGGEVSPCATSCALPAANSGKKVKCADELADYRDKRAQHDNGKPKRGDENLQFADRQRMSRGHYANAGDPHRQRRDVNAELRDRLGDPADRSRMCSGVPPAWSARFHIRRDRPMRLVRANRIARAWDGSMLTCSRTDRTRPAITRTGP